MYAPIKVTLISLVALGLISACGADKDETTDSAAADGAVPEDSTGATGKVSLGVGGLALTEDAAKTLKISDTVELTMARFNIAQIKLKATKEVSEKDKERDADENEKDAAESKEQEAAALALDKPDDAGGKPDATGKPDDAGVKPDAPGKAGRDARRAKIAGHCASHGPKMKADLEGRAKADTSTRFVGPYVYDAVNGAFLGEQPAIAEVADGTYRRVDLKMKRHCSTDAADPLVGNVFVLQGTVKIADKTVPFLVEWHNAVNFRLAGDGAFVVTPGEEAKLALAFDVTKWFDGVDMTKATADAAGTIVVNHKENKDLMQALRRNVHKHLGFAHDKDKDGKVADAEKVGTSDETAAQPAE